MKKIQEVVRSMKWLDWKPGWSRSYKDTNYSESGAITRVAFKEVGFSLATAKASTIRRYETELRKALKAEGHVVNRIMIYPALGELYLYQDFMYDRVPKLIQIG